ncbi:MAG: hypothetical protein E7513_04660 [Ruminococcaceae bacterium]|nr:hypothetical protein [Oscillospiraceae bacterium]
MNRKIDIVFNSEKDNENKCFQIASGYISQTTVLFEKEDIVAVVYAKGRVEFYNMNDELLTIGEVPVVENGKEVYEEICCKVDENAVGLRFPIVEWIDNYPHCDGEHDRWDTRIIGYHTLTFDMLTNSVVCE